MKKMRKRMLYVLLALVAVACSHDTIETNAHTNNNTGRTLVVYYSFTNNVRTIVGELTKQIDADILEVQPAEEGLDYAANNYKIGSALISAIRNNPNSPDSYPAIKPTDVDVAQYDNIIIATPLWWSQMAAPMQTYLFNNATKLSGKHVALIVSSASSNINSVVADAERLVPHATWMGQPLWINNNNRSRTATLLTQWIATLDFQLSTNTSSMYITINNQTHNITLVDNQATQQLVAKLQEGPINVILNTNADFEIWGPLGFSLPMSNEHINAQPGDVVLYNGSNICIFYDTNSWNYTRLGHIDGMTESQLRTFLHAGESNIQVTLSLSSTPSAIKSVTTDAAKSAYYTPDGRKVANPSHGIHIIDGKKVLL